MIDVAIVGASGFIGGELLRILLGHPDVKVTAATSSANAGRPVHTTHPQLFGRTELRYQEISALGRHDVIFLATPSGVAATLVPELESRADLLIDLSPDFRVRDQEVRERHYGPHPSWELTERFTTGMPELYRDALRTADRIAVPGCMASAAMLALYPLAVRGLVAGDVTVTALTGSSGGGASPGRSNTHAIRSGAMRVYAPLGHRHEAEITQAVGLPVRMTAIGVEAVRGVQVICHAATDPSLTRRELWEAYRKEYSGEPFVRLVRRRGSYRMPDPKVLLGSNYCDIGLETDEAGRVVAVAALDNLVKGAAGGAVQSLNVRLGLPEDSGLGFPGLHPL